MLEGVVCAPTTWKMGLLVEFYLKKKQGYAKSNQLNIMYLEFGMLSTFGGTNLFIKSDIWASNT